MNKGNPVYLLHLPAGGYVEVFADGSGVEHKEDGSMVVHEHYTDPPPVTEETDEIYFQAMLPHWYKN